MTFSADRNLNPPAGDEEHVVDGSRPLTSAEREAAERDHPLRERVYAPASERVPVEPVAGHRDMVEHTDTDTPERQAVSEEESPGMPGFEPAAEPPFTRVTRPSTQHSTPTSATPTQFTSAVSSAAYESPWNEPHGTPIWQRFSWLVVPACAMIGAWWYVRRRREQNKPINRLRRQAKQTAADLRGRVPDTDELMQPAMGVAAALVSTGLMIGRQVQRQRTLKRARSAMSDADWQKRLIALKGRWHPRRLELEKISISKH